MEGYDYEAASRTVKIDDITSDFTNQSILRKLKENDPDFDKLWVTDGRFMVHLNATFSYLKMVAARDG